MNYRPLADQLKKYPDRYLAFGPYWYFVKDVLRREGFNFGSNDEPGTRAAMLAYHGGNKSETYKAALGHYNDHIGSLNKHNWKLPDGSPYVLHDPDVYLFSQI